jgi:hypothetical protein
VIASAAAGGRPRRPRTALAAACSSKDEASVYEGGPTRRWLKVKQKGWTDAEDRWQRRLFTRGA